MEKIRLGKTELMVTRIGFGGIPIQTPPEEEAVRIVRDSLDRGVNYIDTSKKAGPCADPACCVLLFYYARTQNQDGSVILGNAVTCPR